MKGCLRQNVTQPVRPVLEGARLLTAHHIATGATCSFTTDRIPDRLEVHTRWKMEGVVVGGGESR
ncbi:MAG TPA: hypothetical protein PLN54_15205 [Flavobacteriales bacterium]|nr:hypothetical protein [Flavobacteriales bacterium]